LIAFGFSVSVEMDTKYINDGKRGDTKKRSDTLESLVVSDGTRREKMWFAEQDSAQHVYDCLTSFLENKFKHIRGTTFELLYRDAEGDEITVKTPAELKEAIRCLRSASTVEFRYQAAPQITMRTVDDKTVAANAHAGRVEMTPVVHNARPDGVLGAVIIDAVANQSTNTGGERQTLESVDAVTKSPVIGFPGANSDCARQTLESELKKMYEAGTRPFDENCGSGWWYVIPFALQLLFIILRICQVINWPYKLLFIPTQIAFAWWYLLRRIVIVTLDRNGFFEKLFQHAMILAPNLSHPKFWFSHLPT
jgi:PB1 domain